MLALADPRRQLVLKPGSAGVLEWQGRWSTDTPWTAVVVPDVSITLRKEVLGAAWDR
jgi:hypothetical protein